MRGTSMHTKHALCRDMRWLSLGLFLLVAACTNAPAHSCLARPRQPGQRRP